MRSLAVLIALLGAALPVFAQQQPALQEQIDVNAVLLDVIVTDTKGNQILGLSKDDFEVKENGVAQPVDSVDYFTNRRLLDTREENAPFKVERVREERYFIFFFDKPQEPGTLFDRLNNARSSVRDFIRNQMKEGDQVAIAGHDVRLKIYSDFTSDKAQLERALEETAKLGKGVTEGSTPILSNIARKTMMNKTGTVYQALEVLADAVRPVRARKNLVLFSPGIADINERVMAGMLVDRSRHLDPALHALNAANVSVYGVQLQQSLDADLSSPIVHQRLSELSTETGGKYFQFNTSFQPAVNQVEENNAGYYLLTYRARKTRGEKGFQRVQVSVKGQPQLRVTSRAGYEFGS
ncbi:MAG TPA: VWA domain-containing protein [Thermoanaerobaculia bacterium]|nr:VWA domain-containing protein [Thermoanaerobaculia bacterium]